MARNGVRIVVNAKEWRDHRLMSSEGNSSSEQMRHNGYSRVRVVVTHIL